MAKWGCRVVRHGVAMLVCGVAKLARCEDKQLADLHAASYVRFMEEDGATVRM